MGILDKIKDIEKEMERTQRNKATEFHFGMMKARLAKLRSQLLDPPKKSGMAGEGFDVQKHGHARVAMIGFPSVGKSTILSHFTETESEVNERDFTTLTCIPGMIYYNNCKVQLLDLPGIIEGASEGKGKGRQVISCAKSADLILIVLDSYRYKDQKDKILKELDLVGIRINKDKPNINIKQTSSGGIQLMCPYKLTKTSPEEVKLVMHEYKINNAQVMFRDDYDIDDLIDTLEGNRRYIRTLFVYNKIDTISLEDVEDLLKQPDTLVLSCKLNLGTEFFLEKMWDYLGLVRVYTKKKGMPPDFEEPIVLRINKGGYTIAAAVNQIHRELQDNFKEAVVWGKSVKYTPQKCGLSHVLADEDVMQIMKKNK